MPRPGVAYDTVKGFIEDYAHEQGKTPPIAVIIAECGGSATTIARHKRQWLAEQVQSPEPDRRLRLPPTLEQSLAAGAEHCWAELMEALGERERILETEAEARSDAAAEVEQRARGAVAAATERADGLAGELGRTRLERDGLREALQAQMVELADERIARSASDADRGRLEENIVECRRLLSESEARSDEARRAYANEIDKLRRSADAALVQLRGALEGELEHGRAERAEQDRALAEREQAQSALAAEAQQLEAGLRAEHAALTAALTELRRNLSQARSDLSQARRTQLDAVKALAHATGRSEVLAADLAAERERHAGERLERQKSEAAWQARLGERERSLAASEARLTAFEEARRGAGPP